MSEEQSETQDPPGEDEAGEGEAGEGEAGEGEAGEGEAGEGEAGEGEAGEGEAGEGEVGEGEAGEGEVGEGEAVQGEVAQGEAGEAENETEATADDETPDDNAQEIQEQEPPGSAEPAPVEYTENEVQTDFTFSPTASNTDIARILLESLEADEAGEIPAEAQEEETEEGADKEPTEEGEDGEAATEGTEDAVETEQEEETVIEDWIKETKGKKPKESRAMWDYSLYAPISMLREQVVEPKELDLPILAKYCQPMWDYDLLADTSMLQTQVDDTYELKLQLSSLKCEPMWDYQLSVPPELAEAQVYFEEKELRFDVSSLKCHPMWDYDLSAPIQKVPEEIYWVPSYLNFEGVTREKFFHIEETPNTKFIQTDLHFDPDIIIQPEDLLREPNEDEEEKRRCYTDPKHVLEGITDIVDESDETWSPGYLTMVELKTPYKLVGERCVAEEEDTETTTGEGEEPGDEVTSIEVQTDVGLGELLESESISSVPEAGDLQGELTTTADESFASEGQPAVDDTETLEKPEENELEESETQEGENAPEESETQETGGEETTAKGEPDVPWALLSESAIAPQPFLLPQEDDILSTVSLAPTAERQENKFNFAVTLGGSVWGFPEYNAEDETVVSTTVLPQNAEEFTWVPDSNTPFESSVFAPISEEDALLLESVHADAALQVTHSGSFKIDTLETDEQAGEMSKGDEAESEFTSEPREQSPSRAPVIEVEITMVPAAVDQNSSEPTPQIEVGVAWEALPESLVDGRTPDIIVTTVLEEAKK